MGKTVDKKHKMANLFVLLSFFVAIVGLTTWSLVLVNKAPKKINITTEEELINISENLNGYYALRQNITITKPWKPIGTKENPFRGTIDGNNYSIIFNGNGNIGIDSDDNLLGLVKYNSGTIIKTRIYGLNINLENENETTFGSFAAINNGKVTSCLISNSNIVLTTKSVIAGLIVGENNGDIRNCGIAGQMKATSTQNDCVVGGIVGQMNKGIIEYNYRHNGTYIFANTIADNDNCNSTIGCAIGVLKSGTISNNYFGCSQNTVTNIKGYMSSGGIAGTIEQNESIVIKNNYIRAYSHATNQDFPANLNVGGVCGTIIRNDVNSVTIENCILDISSTLTLRGNNNAYCGYITFNLGDINSKNCYVLDEIIYTQNVNKNGATKTNLSQLSLSKMHWDEAIWGIHESGIVFKRGQ